MRNDLELNLLGNQNIKYEFGYNPRYFRNL